MHKEKINKLSYMFVIIRGNHLEETLQNIEKKLTTERRCLSGESKPWPSCCKATILTEKIWLQPNEYQRDIPPPILPFQACKSLWRPWHSGKMWNTLSLEPLFGLSILGYCRNMAVQHDGVSRIGPNPSVDITWQAICLHWKLFGKNTLKVIW